MSKNIRFKLRKAKTVLGPKHYICYHDGTRDWIRPTANMHHLHSRMPIDHCLNLLRVDLEPSDINNSFSSPNEKESIAALLHEVSRIDEPISVSEWRWRTQIVRC